MAARRLFAATGKTGTEKTKREGAALPGTAADRSGGGEIEAPLHGDVALIWGRGLRLFCSSRGGRRRRGEDRQQGKQRSSSVCSGGSSMVRGRAGVREKGINRGERERIQRMEGKGQERKEDRTFSTDFYIIDQKSGMRAMVKAGSGCKVVPLIVESKLVTTTRQCSNFSPHLRKWLQERHLPAEARLLRLEEGYVQEGGLVTVVGMLHRHNDLLMIVHPQELLSTGCLWHKFSLPVDIDELIIGVPETAVPNINPVYRQQLEQ
ncbi:hypothetical protein Tsubulata_037423 [Turnera subulata]|uniref:Uncharacterized protein n=1 Tax=Turnera subulata TaxID=218843 RepID=A0A9Q0FT67_9ROSI|nr:hypothetical protein Tsubulata_037423 [Turnera subulata]